MRAGLLVTLLAACGGGKAASGAAGSGSAAAAGSGAATASAAGSGSGAGSTRGSAAAAAAAAAARPAPTFERPGPADAVVDLWGECATRASGHVDCWDSADSHVQRVDGVDDALAMRDPPSRSSADLCLIRRGGVDCGDHKFPGITDAIDIVSGDLACVLRKSGGVVCRTGGRSRAEAVPKLSDAIALVTNEWITCAVRRTGAVMCAAASDPRHWRPVRGLTNVRAIAVARLTNDVIVACAVHADGELRCYDVTGHGTVATKRSGAKEPALDLSAFHDATAIVMAPDTDLPQPTALVGGQVVVFDGQRTRTLPLLADAVAITGHCALRGQGSVVCWDEDAPTAVPL